MKLDPIHWLAVFLLLALAGLGYYTWSSGVDYEKEITSLKNDNLKLSTANAICEANRTTLKGTIKHQNDEIERWKFDKEKADNRWNNRKSGSQYVDEWLDKNNIDQNTSERESCENNNIILNSIGTNGF